MSRVSGSGETAGRAAIGAADTTQHPLNTHPQSDTPHCHVMGYYPHAHYT